MDEGERLTVGGVLLAAGQSSRYGPANKLLEPIDGTPMVSCVAETAVESALDEVVAVVGHDRDAVSAAIDSCVDAIAYNGDYSAGQSTSVQRGAVLARQRGWDAAVFCLGDMPFVTSATIDRLRRTFTTSTATIVVPQYDDQRGNPVLFDQTHFRALTGLSGDMGGRELLLAHDGAQFIDVPDRGVVRDIDTPRQRVSYSWWGAQ